MNAPHRSNFTKLYNRDIHTPHSNWTICYRYNQQQQSLYLTFKNGRQFRYDNVEPSEFDKVLSSNHKTKELRHLIGGKSAEFVQVFTPDELRLLTMPRSQYNHLAR